MPSLPTSLILVGLVLAWLIVLVPMVARRREHVPEIDDENPGYRVLDTAETAPSRPDLTRTTVPDRQRSPRDEGDMTDEIDDSNVDNDAQPLAQPVAAMGEYRADSAADTSEDSDVMLAEYGAETSDFVIETAGTRVGSERKDRPARPQGDTPRRRYDLGDEAHQPVPVPAARTRRGRGGFDPRAAEELRADRFRRRRRTALALTLAAIIGCLYGYFADASSGWIAGAVAGTLLILYFAYLRRQVRIEEDIRARRSARLVEPRRRFIDEYDENSAAPSSRSFRAPVAVTAVPPRFHKTGIPVDIDDSDPAFDELDHYQPQTWRRASGM